MKRLKMAKLKYSLFLLIAFALQITITKERRPKTDAEIKAIIRIGTYPEIIQSWYRGDFAYCQFSLKDVLLGKDVNYPRKHDLLNIDALNMICEDCGIRLEELVNALNDYTCKKAISLYKKIKPDTKYLLDTLFNTFLKDVDDEMLEEIFSLNQSPNITISRDIIRMLTTDSFKLPSAEEPFDEKSLEISESPILSPTQQEERYPSTALDLYNDEKETKFRNTVPQNIIKPIAIRHKK
jgi:hypothetical protein